MFDEFIQYYYVVPIFSLLIVIISFWINHRDITSLENKLMTNFKKLQIFFSTIFIESITIGIILSVLFYISQGLPGNLIDEDGIFYFGSILPFIIALALLSLGISLMLHISLLIAKKLFSIKICYYVELPNSDKKWYLERRSNKNQILLTNDKVEFIFLSEWNEQVFKAEQVEFTKFQKIIYSNEKKMNLIIGSLLLSTITIYLFLVFLKLDLLETFILMFAMLFLLTIFVWLDKTKKIIYKK